MHIAILSKLISKRAKVNYDCIELVICAKPSDIKGVNLRISSNKYHIISQNSSQISLSLQNYSSLDTPISKCGDGIDMFRAYAVQADASPNIPLSKWCQEVTIPESQINHIMYGF